MFHHQLTTLENGLRLVTIPMPQIGSIAVMVGVGAGSRFETKRTNGIFHFLEHMAFKGTKARPNALKIATVVDSIGGEFNAFTSREYTGYYVRLAAKHQTLAYDILSDILLNSIFQNKEIEKERGVIIEEINMRQDSPTKMISEAFFKLLFGDNSMGWSIAGEKTSVLNIKRKDFFNSLEKFYFPQNMVVAVAGNLKSSEQKKLAINYFQGFSRQGDKKQPKLRLIQDKPRLKLIYKKTEQAHFCLGMTGYGYHHPDRFALGLLTTILGGGMSSRLFTEIREKRGLAYYVSCFPDYFTDCGYLMARAGVKISQVEEAIKIIMSEFERMTKIRVASRELKKAKEYLKGHLILALEDSWRVASRYAGQVLLEKKIRTPKQALVEIEKVTSEDVMKVAKDIFKPEKFNLSLIGPYKSENKFRNLLE